MVETRDHLGPVVIGVRRADDGLAVRIELPQAEKRLQAVPAGRHAHVDERHRVGALLLERVPDPRPALLPLERGVDLECRARDAWGRFTEQQPLGRQELRAALGIAAEDLTEVLVDGDRKSTRLNSSHITISYAVFCLKKKKTNDQKCGICLGYVPDWNRS